MNAKAKFRGYLIFGALALATSARGAVLVSTALGPDVGPASGESYLINFDSPVLPTGVTLSGDGQRVTPGSGYLSPLGDTTPFLVTPVAGPSGSSELGFADFLGGRGVSHFSFYWGSINKFNTLQLFDRSAHQIVSLSGETLIGDLANGSATDPSANRRVFFTLTGSSRNLGSLRFTSTSPAFEADSFSFATVPEPGTWVTMILGLGGVGALMRRRRPLPLVSL